MVAVSPAPACLPRHQSALDLPTVHPHAGLCPGGPEMPRSTRLSGLAALAEPEAEARFVKVDQRIHATVPVK
jgi:hypothetical protein